MQNSTDLEIQFCTELSSWVKPRHNPKKFRVRYDKIVSFEPYSDGLGVPHDAQTAKPQTFRTGGSWFTYNLNQSQGGIYICGAMKIGLGATVKLFQMYLKGGPAPPLAPLHMHIPLWL